MNTIEICPKYHDNEADMNKDVGAIISILVKNGYQCKVCNDGYTTSIEYDFTDEQLQTYNLCWVDPDVEVCLDYE